ncbi:hypothetical protein [Methanolobus chelungpuianus]|uniref:Uncharacterized protein n=1 Tax=Methanolobus chelungpuianus TaxID=502115 RepID=A0AAE3H8D3_9EURY|nr:hypothetical protein [Methanolobus chelungpuianus]MCQ6961876.1 hypothetical protein [Methanolobus chelungpuianus]
MKLHGKKALACFSMLLMVLSIIPSGALANESSSRNATDISDLAEGKFKGRGHGPMEKPSLEMPEFETEEEEFEYLKEMMTNVTEMRIERTTSIIEDIDEIGDENLTAESLEEQLSELKTLLGQINSATTLDELKEFMSESMRMGPGREMRGKGPGMEMPEFETEEEQLDFEKARTEESVDRMIEMLENTTLEETDPDNITSKDIEAVLSQLEEIKIKLSNENLTLEDIKEVRESMSEIMDSVREILPAPVNEGRHGPRLRGSQEEVAA